MGLLDDAIREHLELKRLKGADPGDVARDEREALGEGNHQLGGEHGDGSERMQTPHPQAPSNAGERAAIFEPDTQTRAGQETVEFDMDSVLAGGERSPRPGTTGSDREPAAPTGHTHHAPQPEDSLEWEVPGGPELGDEDHDSVLRAAPDDEPVEDVLEATPDFLRDTPEQERLWFEQRPPRDFDFDE